MAGATGSDVDRRRYSAYQRHAQPRPEAVESGTPDRAGGERYLSAGESETRRARVAASLRVRADRRAAEAGGRHRFNSGADRDPLTRIPALSRLRFFAGAYVAPWLPLVSAADLRFRPPVKPAPWVRAMRSRTARHANG